jgi:stalled ribosome alternative rescue factor ArfA
MDSPHDNSGCSLVSTPVFSEGAENPTRGRVGSPKRKRKKKGKGIKGQRGELRFRRANITPPANIIRKIDVGSGTLATRNPTSTYSSDGTMLRRNEEARL